MFKRALFGQTVPHDLVLFSLRCSASRHPWKTHRQPPESGRSERLRQTSPWAKSIEKDPPRYFEPDAVLNGWPTKTRRECGNAFLGERVPAQPRLRLLMCVTSCPRLSETQDHITHFGRSGRTKAKEKPAKSRGGPLRSRRRYSVVGGA